MQGPKGTGNHSICYKAQANLKVEIKVEFFCVACSTPLSLGLGARIECH